jgi:hypothetical protein
MQVTVVINQINMKIIMNTMMNGKAIMPMTISTADIPILATVIQYLRYCANGFPRSCE